MKRQKFELSRSPVDGKIRRWELKKASEIKDLETGRSLVTEFDMQEGGARDYFVWVITGVFKSRREVFLPRR